MLVPSAVLDRFAAQPPNSDARRQFVGLHSLRDAAGRELGVFAVTGHAEVQGQVVCIVRWNPDLATEADARAAFERLFLA
jgi:hypothetical protein